MDTARIKYTEGTGGFLNPPGHPEHTVSVETDLQRRPENRGSISLFYAATCDYIPEDVRADAARILAEWQPLPLSARDAQLWLKRIFAYFANCYRGEGDESIAWNADNVEITRESRPVEKSAAVHFIRKYYPDFAQDFDGDAQALAALYPSDCVACGHHVNAHANGEGGKCTVITRELHSRFDKSPYLPADLCSCPSFEA